MSDTQVDPLDLLGDDRVTVTRSHVVSGRVVGWQQSGFTVEDERGGTYWFHPADPQITVVRHDPPLPPLRFGAAVRDGGGTVYQWIGSGWVDQGESTWTALDRLAKHVGPLTALGADQAERDAVQAHIDAGTW